MKPLSVMLSAPVILFSMIALAQDATAQLERVALTSPPDADWRYSLMGEFVGPIKKGEGYEPLGLQIRPLGPEGFEAIQYEGGLPGQPSFTGKALQLVGRRSDDLVVLSGGPWAIFVEQDLCTIVDRKGNKVGQLDRVQRGSPTMGAKAPEGATILFDGSNTEQFSGGRMTEDGLLMEGADLLPMFQDFDLHIEFRLAFMPNSDGQQRSNSGCYLQSRYEVQVLDSFAQLPQFNGCSSLYRQKAPDLNMCYPPLQWQTYDIHFTAPRWAADGKKTRNARITVWQNGVKTHDDYEIKAKTGAGKPEEPSLLPIRIQNHTDPVRFRNIWIVDRGLTHAEFPVYATESDTAPAVEEAETVAQAEEAVDAETVVEAEASEGADVDAKPTAKTEENPAEETPVEPEAPVSAS